MKDQDLEILLPWYVNGTLDANERAEVEALLARSADAREQVNILQNIAEQVQSEVPADVSELGWRRLQRDIRAETKQSPQDWWKKGIAAAAMLVIALQVGILAKDPATEVSNNTRLLSEGVAGLEQPHWLLQVEFKTEAPWQQITAVISRIDGRIVDGPTGLGLMRIAVPKAQSEFTEADQLLVWLRQQSVITHVALESQK